MTFADIRRWAAVATAVVAVSVVLGWIGVPSHTLIGATLVGVLVALWFPQRMVIGHGADRASQAVIGVALGATVSAATLPELGAAWLPVTLVTLGTVLSTVALGLLLRRTSGLDTGTALLASVPGGAVGLVVMAREMGTDERIVAFSQYLRVLVIVIAAPLVATALVVGHGGGAFTPEPLVAGVGAIVVAAVAGTCGWLLGRAVGLPAPALLGPMLVTAVVALTLPSLPAHVPAPMLEAAFALIGLDVGLRFTGDALRRCVA